MEILIPNSRFLGCRETMTLEKRGEYCYGDSQSDIREEIIRYSKAVGYVADSHFADAVCKCGGRIFSILLDGDEGAVARTCIQCDYQHPIGDSEDYLDEADLHQCECLCGAETFEVTAGIALYPESDDVRWFYLGLRCQQCGLTGVYGDWKNEYTDYRKLLEMV
jgi:uncharacterized protein YacL (UPF0231 family)